MTQAEVAIRLRLTRSIQEWRDWPLGSHDVESNVQESLHTVQSVLGLTALQSAGNRITLEVVARTTHRREEWAWPISTCRQFENA